MRKLLSYLRIAFSAVCGITCLLLIALWMWSYWTLIDYEMPSGPGTFRFVSQEGTFAGVYYQVVLTKPRKPYLWLLPANDESRQLMRENGFSPDKMRRPKFTPGYGLYSPYWAPTIPIAIAAAAPWSPRRFSLRTLIIAMTLVGVVLGLIIYASRK